MADQPMNPLAGAAGPGPFATRTDNLTFKSDTYGAGVENAKNKAGAPLAKTPDVRPTSLSEQGMAPSQVERITPLFAPSQRLDDSLQGSIARPRVEFAVQQTKTSDALAQLLPFDNTGEITILYQEALARGD
jgi:hypothetical protein